MVPDSMRTSSAVPGIPSWFHAVAAAWIVAMLWLARAAPDAYYAAMQEDRATEWATAALFAAAAVAAGVRAWRGRGLGDLLVAAFCVVAAGEEISWGQRLVGFTPPDVFLAHNIQQEANLHNMVEVFGQPKWALVLILVAYGLVAPLLVGHSQPVRRLAERLGFTAPPLVLAPWFVAVIAIMIVYPVRFTGEWAEALAGLLFLVAQRIAARRLALVVGAIVVLAFALERTVALRGAGDVAAFNCARAEVAALADAFVRDGRSTGVARRRQHRRVWSVVRTEEQRASLAAGFAAATDACGAASASPDQGRRAYFVDPWGTAYWVRIAGPAQQRTVEVYSFGPNRRRDPDGAGDDIAVSRVAAP